MIRLGIFMGNLHIRNKSDKEINSMINLIPALTIWIDDHLVIKNVNEQFLSLLKKTKKEVENTSLSDYPFQNLNLFFENFELLKNRDLNILDSFNILESRKSIRFYINEVKTLNSFLIIGIDISNDIYRNDAHEQVKNQEEENARFMIIGQIATGMSHEINNPLSVIVGYLSTMRKLMEKEGDLFDKKVVIEKISKSLKNCERISKIVWGLKCLVKNEANFPVESVLLQDILSDAFDLCADKIKLNNIDLNVDNIEPDMMIECNRIQIAHVLFNLLINSIDAIRLNDIRWIKVSFCFENESSIISVTDSGTGISEEIVNKIMQPFFTTKNINEGIGLGLSSSKMILKNHKGDLVYDSTGPNTKFNVIIKR